MESISKAKFKSRALEVMRRVEATGDPVLITDRRRPVLELRRHKPAGRDPLALLKGSVIRYDRPTAPLSPEDWESLR